MPGKTDYYKYTSDDGNEYSVKIREFNATVTAEDDVTLALGFGAQDLSKPLMPRGMRPRKVRVQDPTGGATRSIPCGVVTAPAWDGTDTTLKQDYSGISGLVDFNIVGKTGEHVAQVAHAITNLSDAA